MSVETAVVFVSNLFFIQIWNTKATDNRQDALFTVYTYGQVSKLNWHPNEKYQIACFTRTIDYRIHIWDVRRAYLPQISFCHHQSNTKLTYFLHSFVFYSDEIDDFLWQPKTDNIISIGRDERLIHAPLASAIRSEDIVSLFSLNVTPNGHVHITMPNLDNEYIQSQIVHRKSLTIKDFYSYRMLQSNIEWSKSIRGKSLLMITKTCCHDRSIEEFHYLAMKWIFGNGRKCLDLFSKICDENSHWSEEINRFDLSATWQVIKRLFANTKHSGHSSKTSRSLTKSRFLSDSLNNSRRKLTVIIDKYEQIIDEKSTSKINSNLGFRNRFFLFIENINFNFLESIDELDSYIVRDTLTDDLVFLTPDDLVNYQQYDELPTRDQINSILDIDFDESIIDNQTTTTTTDVIYVDDDDDLESQDEYDK